MTLGRKPPIFTWNPARCYNWLQSNEEHFLNYLILKGGSMVPLDYDGTQEAVRILRNMGFVDDGIEPGVVEITDDGQRLMDDWNKYLFASGQAWRD